jgi:hypothetical protein
LNYLLSSHVWRQDHNGFSHQDPGFIDLVTNKASSVVRIYLPPDANTLLSVADHCLRSTDYINVIVADKQPQDMQYLDMEAAIAHCTKGLGIWNWASNDQGTEPDVVLASCGDLPTLECLAAAALLRQHIPDIKIRVVNVVDLFKLLPSSEHPHGLTDCEFEAIFTADKPVVFTFHGYAGLIHRLTYRRPSQHNLHVRGYKEQGNINTPLELAIRNQTDRFTLAMDAIDRIPRLRNTAAGVRQELANQQIPGSLAPTRRRVGQTPRSVHRAALEAAHELTVGGELGDEAEPFGVDQRLRREEVERRRHVGGELGHLRLAVRRRHAAVDARRLADAAFVVAQHRVAARVEERHVGGAVARGGAPRALADHDARKRTGAVRQVEHAAQPGARGLDEVFGRAGRVGCRRRVAAARGQCQRDAREKGDPAGTHGRVYRPSKRDVQVCPPSLVRSA